MAAKAKSVDRPAPPRRPWLVYAAAGALLAWYFIASVSAVADKSITFDEPDHLTAGYSYWKFGDFRMESGGVLSQRWAAIPLLFGDTHFPNLEQDAWRQSSIGDIEEQFLYGVGNDPDAMLLRARAMIALLGVALGALVFFWTRSLLGLGPAFVSLALYAFCPTMLANGALVTVDMAAALFFTASMLCIWRVLHQVNLRTLAIGSLAVGGLFATKFSAFMLVPMGLVLVAIQLISRQPTAIAFGGRRWDIDRRSARAAVHLATIVVHAIIVWIVIWACYNFRYEMFAAKTLQTNPAGEMIVVDSPLVPWNTLLDKSGMVEQLIGRMRDAHILPEAYLYGFAHMWRFAQQRSAFLNGQFSLNGWPQFFPYCLLVKTPLTLFVLLSCAAAWLMREWHLAGETWRARRDARLSVSHRPAMDAICRVLGICDYEPLEHRAPAHSAHLSTDAHVCRRLMVLAGATTHREG